MAGFTPAQSIATKSIVSIQANAEPVSSVLDRLARATGATFSYNPDQIESTRTVTFRFTNMPLGSIISSLFPEDKFGIRYSGKQIVIYRRAENMIHEEFVSAPVLQQNKENSIPDTVFIVQTQLQKDTLRLTDTVTRFDTVYIMRTIMREAPVSTGDIFSDQSRLSESQNGVLLWTCGITATTDFAMPHFRPVSASEALVTAYRENYSGGAFSGGLAFDLLAGYKSWIFRSGIGYTTLASRLDYLKTDISGGYFRHDTLDAYYAIAAGDTTWFYVTDSTYLPVDAHSYRIESMLRHHYIEIPVEVRYTWPLGRGLVFAGGGFSVSFATGNKGWLITDSSQGVVSASSADFSPVVLSGIIGTGMLWPLNRAIILEGGFRYKTQLNQVIRNFPVEIRYSALGIKVGITFRF